VQETDDETAQSGFLIYVPVYHGGSIPATVDERRRLIYGFVYTPFRAGDLLKQIVDPVDVQRMEVSVYAGDGPASESNWLYTSPAINERTRYQTAKTFEVAGQPWILVLRAGSSFTGTARRTATTAVVIVGIVLSLLLFAITMTQAKARAGAESIAEELRRSEEALRAANRSKDEFLAVVSHELRTPLNAIIGWAAMLRRGQVIPERQAHALQVIERNAHAQARLVEDLLDISRAVAGRLRLEAADVDVTTTLQATVDALRPTASEQSVEIVLRAPAALGTITADQARLQQIVSNLVGNAIKFTPSGGKVTLAASRDGDGLMIQVIDTGIGIRREFLPFAFDRFRQADTSTTRSHGGIGLGLAIVRHLVELHGGTIDVTSDGENLGSTFTVRVPSTPDFRRTSL
jgi:signal transduction histidine kinase